MPGLRIQADLRKERIRIWHLTKKPDPCEPKNTGSGSEAATGVQPEGARFFRNKLFQKVGTNLKKKEQNSRKKDQNLTLFSF